MNTLPSVRVKLSSKKLREKNSKITPFRAGLAKKDCGKISKITLKSANVTHVTSADFQSKSRKKIARKSNEFKDNIKESFNDFLTSVEDQYHDLTSKAEDMMEEGKANLERINHELNK